mmetsp:Transcript_39034/g.83063  ORF Transcript_39034/g.83063 Transcript_39034/m.83063 type:complete len:277 (+) Transcript_39034:313-1143(+)
MWPQGTGTVSACASRQILHSPSLLAGASGGDGFGPLQLSEEAGFEAGVGLVGGAVAAAEAPVEVGLECLVGSGVEVGAAVEAEVELSLPCCTTSTSEQAAVQVHSTPSNITSQSPSLSVLITRPTRPGRATPQPYLGEETPARTRTLSPTLTVPSPSPADSEPGGTTSSSEHKPVHKCSVSPNFTLQSPSLSNIITWPTRPCRAAPHPYLGESTVARTLTRSPTLKALVGEATPELCPPSNENSSLAASLSPTPGTWILTRLASNTAAIVHPEKEP